MGDPLRKVSPGQSLKIPAVAYNAFVDSANDYIRRKGGKPGGPKSISIAAVRRTAQQLCKDEVATRKKLANFAVTHGATKVPFSFGVHLDGEVVETGTELDVVFTSPLASGRKQDLEEVRRRNQAAGAKGKTASKTVIRAGYGIFFDRFAEANVLQALRYAAWLAEEREVVLATA